MTDQYFPQRRQGTTVQQLEEVLAAMIAEREAEALYERIKPMLDTNRLVKSVEEKTEALVSAMAKQRVDAAANINWRDRQERLERAIDSATYAFVKDVTESQEFKSNVLRIIDETMRSSAAQHALGSLKGQIYRVLDKALERIVSQVFEEEKK